MQSITKAAVAFALTFALGAASAARADDAFGDAQDDAPVADVAQDASRLPLALAPDAHDDSGLSARSFQPPSDAASVSAFAIGPDAHDDAGISASDLEPYIQSGA
ncbi:MAG TPA: hypothetical protein VEM76_18450 [Anaeromyxobacteraceae bacterium]|nr:hypothetical protein [Anaeromyxobacteraceae bacterium]